MDITPFLHALCAVAAQVLHAGTIQKEIASGESGVDKQKSASEKKNRWFKRLFRG